MTTASVPLTRRTFGALTLSVPLAGAAASVGVAAPLEDRLRSALRSLDLPYQPAKASLVRLSARPTGGFSVVVRLDWPPGVRQRRFQSAAVDEVEAFDALLSEIEAYFRSLA